MERMTLGRIVEHTTIQTRLASSYSSRCVTSLSLPAAEAGREGGWSTTFTTSSRFSTPAASLDAIQRGGPVLWSRVKRRSHLEDSPGCYHEPGGALKWRESFSGYFKGTSVVILPDNDDPGRKHAEDVAGNSGARVKCQDREPARHSGQRRHNRLVQPEAQARN